MAASKRLPEADGYPTSTSHVTGADVADPPRLAAVIYRWWDGARVVGLQGLKSRLKSCRQRGHGLAHCPGVMVSLLVAAACSTAAPTGPTDSSIPTPTPGEPSAIRVSGGDAQTAPIGTPVSTVPQVRVVNQSGAGVPGVAVVFEVTVGGGSVESSTVATDGQGIASAGTWTLGAAGQQQLQASAPGVGSVTFTATALATPAAIVATAGDAQTTQVGTLVPIAPEVRVTDAAGDPVAGASVAFAVVNGGGSLAGGTVTTDADGRARVGSWTLGVTDGPNALSAVLSAGGVSLDPVMFTANALPGPPSNILASQGDGQTAPGASAVPVRPQVRVTDAHGNGVAGVSVTFAVTGGSGSVASPNQPTDADGRATVGSWVVGSAAGPNSLTATASGGAIPGNPVIFTATSTGGGSGGSGTYDIEIRYNPASSPTSAQAAAFSQAEAAWEAIITGDLVDTPVDRPAGTCTSTVPINETVDDLIIYVTVEPIDGAGGVLGSAGPCLIRSGSLLTLVGQMRLDVADLATMEANGVLDEVIAHEMGHVLGIGALWSALGLLLDPSLFGGVDPHFIGTNATLAFNAVGGSGYAGAKVPVEDTGGPGTADSQWRETVFGSELMTGWVNGGSNPLSLVTVASLTDLGYAVDSGQAASYSLPVSALIVPAPGPGVPRLKLVADIWRVPLEIIAPSGASLGLVLH